MGPCYARFETEMGAQDTNVPPARDFVLVRGPQRCFALAKPRGGVASDFADGQSRLVYAPFSETYRGGFKRYTVYMPGKMEPQPRSASAERKPTMRRQVPENDPVYLAERKHGVNAYSSEIFGLGAVHAYERGEEESEHIAKQQIELEAALAKIENKEDEHARYISELITTDRERAERMCERGVTSLYESFEKLSTDALHIALLPEDMKGRKEYVLSELRDMFSAPEVQEVLNTQIVGNFSESIVENLYFSVKDKIIPPAILYAAARSHLEKAAKQQEELEHLFEQIKKEFAEEVQVAVAEGWLPQSAADALGRINSVAVLLTDRLKSVHSGTSGTHDSSGKITVDNEQLKAKNIPLIREVIFHELVHEIAGKLVNIETTHDERFGDMYRLKERKTGMALKNPRKPYSPNTWLNEAITEWVALRLSKYDGDKADLHAYKGSLAYITERKELDRLFELGLDEKTVTDAAFENITADQEKGEKGKHFAALVQRVNELEGPGGFNRMENQYIMRKVDDAMYELGALPENADFIKKAKEPGARIFEITVEVGNAEKIKVTKKFRYTANPPTEKFQYSAKEWQKDAEKTIAYLKFKYSGKVTCRVGEVES